MTLLLALLGVFYRTSTFLLKLACSSSLCKEGSKLKRFVAARSSGEWDRVMLTLANLKVEKRDLFHIHVASAGELEQAIAVANGLNRSMPCAFTVSYTSPSTEPFLCKFPTSLASFALPMGDRRRIRAILSSAPYRGVFFIRYDLWPHLVAEANSLQIPCFLIAATQESARAQRIWGTQLLKLWALKKLTHIFCVSEQDRTSFAALLGPEKVSIAGDPKWSRALERALSEDLPDESVNALRKLVALRNKHLQTPVIVFGSPHREELEIAHQLAATLNGHTTKNRELSGDEQSLLLIVAPHEVDRQSIEKVEESFALQGLKCVRMSELTQENAGPGREFPDEVLLAMRLVVIVDTMGHLADVYKCADIAVVGGGFDGGLHNCLEPAAQGAATLFGDRVRRAPEATQLTSLGAARSFSSPSDLFQFLLQCATVQGDGASRRQKAEEVAHISLQSAKIFAEVPQTHLVIMEVLGRGAGSHH